MYIALFVLLGAAIGSFLNVCIDRLPAGKSLAHPPSHCDGCGRRLTFVDMAPVLSYIFLRGRCRHCHSSIPRRVLFVEVASATVFGVSFWHYGLSAGWALLAYYWCLFTVLGIIDLERGLIPNRVLYPAMGVGLIIAALQPDGRLASGVIGGAVGLGLMMVPALISRGGMGWGDVKMAALIGLASGFPLILVSLFAGVVVGGMVAGTLVILRLKSWKEAVPFGPFLSATALITLVWGNDIITWYLRMM